MTFDMCNSVKTGNIQDLDADSGVMNSSLAIDLFRISGLIVLLSGLATQPAAVFLLLFILLGDTVVVNEQSLLRIY